MGFDRRSDAQWKRFEFSPEKLPVYEATLRLQREVVIQPAIDPRKPQLYRTFREACLDDRGQLRIRAALLMQACSDRECYPPESIPIDWTLRFDAPDLERSPVDLRREFEP